MPGNWPPAEVTEMCSVADALPESNRVRWIETLARVGRTRDTGHHRGQTGGDPIDSSASEAHPLTSSSSRHPPGATPSLYTLAAHTVAKT